MSLRPIDIGTLVAIALVALGVRRETVRANRMESERDRLLVALRDTYVPRSQYESTADARDRLEAAVRDGFLPALHDAANANRESLSLIQAFQQAQPKPQSTGAP